MNRLPDLRELSQAAVRPLAFTVLSWVILCLGFILRLSAYIHNRALWGDEIPLARNIEERTYSALLQPLSYDQAAPVGFLMLEKLAVRTFGDNEYALRLAPLLAGALSLLLFFWLARKCLSPAGTLIALSFFGTADKLVYYSSEVKQYSTDVAIALLLLLGAVSVYSKKLRWWDAAMFGVIGATAIWFSHPCIFVLAGIGTTLTFYNAYRRDWTNAAFISIAGLMWAASFAGTYLVTLRDAVSSNYLLDFWGSSGAFMPLSIRSVSDAFWVVRTFVLSLKNPGGFSLPVLAAFVFLAGFVSVCINKKKYLLVLLSPIPFALMASALHKYPFSDRLLLFIVPSLLVFVAEGISRVWPRAPLIGFALLVLLSFQPVVNAVHIAINHDEREDIKPALGYLREHWRQGDVIYVFYAAKYQFRYYAERYGFSEVASVKGRKADGLGIFDDGGDALRGKRRVWALFLIDMEGRIKERRATLLQELDNAGTRLDSFELTGGSVYLYDLSREKNTGDRQVSPPVAH